MDKQMPLEEVVSGLQAKYPEQLEVLEESLQPAVRVKADIFLQVMRELKEEYGLDFLADLTAVDLGDEGMRGINHVMSWEPYRMLRVEVDVPKDRPRIPSLVELWPAADVQEREAFDMLGIVYEGHPKLTRILLSDNFEGYPLRKDFKVASKR